MSFDSTSLLPHRPIGCARVTRGQVRSGQPIAAVGRRIRYSPTTATSATTHKKRLISARSGRPNAEPGRLYTHAHCACADCNTFTASCVRPEMQLGKLQCSCWLLVTMFTSIPVSHAIEEGCCGEWKDRYGSPSLLRSGLSGQGGGAPCRRAAAVGPRCRC